MKRSKLFTTFISIPALVLFHVHVGNAQVPKRLPLVTCDKSFNEYVSRTKGHEEVIWRSEYFVHPGDSVTYSWKRSYSISNSSSLKILPELLEMGYSKSCSVSANVSVRVNNNTSSKKEIKGYRIHDKVKYMKAVYNGNGACTYTLPIMQVYTGYMLAAK